MKNSILYIFILSIILSSCFKEDDPIVPHPKPDKAIEIIPMTQYYSYQVYFDLASGEQVSSNPKDDFDLLFASSDTGTLIRLNTATFMMAAETPFKEFESISDTAGLDWKFDKSDGNPDSTALFNWIRITGNDTSFSDHVWVINRGINDVGIHRGFKKVKFNSLKNDTYHFTYVNLDNSDLKDIYINKKNGYNHVQFSFAINAEVDFEPERSTWDLLFTQYTTLLFTDEGDPYPYLVTGVLINDAGTQVAFDSTMVFDDVVLEDVIYFDYSTNLDAIGYEWKELYGDINSGDFYYKARTNYNYFIRSKNGLFYKLRFIGFYDPETGEKGFPSFEYQRL